MLQNAFNLRPLNALCRIQSSCLGPACKPGVVNLIKLGGQLIAALYQAGQPTRGVAFAALHHGQVDTVRVGRHVGGAAQTHIVGIHCQLCHHAAQFTQPKLKPQAHQRYGFVRRNTWQARPSNQHQQSVQHLTHLGLGSYRQTFLQTLSQFVVVDDTTLELLEQIDKQDMTFKTVAELNAPGHIQDIYRLGFVWKEQLEPLGNGLCRRLELCRVQNANQICWALEHAVNKSIFQKYPN